MDWGHRLGSPREGAWFISLLGGLFIVIGMVQVYRGITMEGTVFDVLLDLVLFICPSLILIYGGYWLRGSDLDPGLYPRVVHWTLGGLAGMLLVTSLLITNYDDTIVHPLSWAGVNAAIGAVGGFGVGAKEVQALTRAEEAEARERDLRESKEELRTLIELLPVAVFVAESDGEIVEWNDAAERLWGGEIVEANSVADYDKYEAYWSDTGERVQPEEWPLARALEGEEVTDPDEIEIEGFDGESRTVLNHGMPVRDARGEVSRAIMTLIDITERKEYQQKLEASNERLEQFAYAASHDLQEPLRMVSSYLQLIEQRYADQLDEAGREYIDFAVDGADRMRDMIDGLLEYSRIDRSEDNLESVDMNAVVNDVLDDLQMKISETDAEISVESLPDVYGDADQLRQVLQNLIENGIKYSGDEPPKIEISVDRNGAEWVFSVRDEGIGLDESEAETVFGMFERLHAQSDGGGKGIGLAITERIIERHNGDIWVESTPGEGSTFYFTIPTDTDSPDLDSGSAGTIGVQ